MDAAVIKKFRRCGLRAYTAMTEHEKYHYQHSMFLHDRKGSDIPPTPQLFAEHVDKFDSYYRPECRYTYKSPTIGALVIEYDHADNIYMDIFYLAKGQIASMVQQVFGRFKHKKYIVIEYPCKSQHILQELTKQTNLDVNLRGGWIKTVYLCRKPKIPKHLGILKDCNMDVYTHDKVQQFNHKQIITMSRNTVYITFDPPILYERRNTGEHKAHIQNPIATCGDPSITWRPRLNKLDIFSKNNKHQSVYFLGEPNYFMRRQIAIRLDTPGPQFDPEELAEFQTYARQVLFYVNRQAKAIQRAWRHAMACPSYKLCQQRLHREFAEM